MNRMAAFTLLIAGGLVGGAAAYVADAESGRRRRALLRDRMLHLATVGRRRSIRFARHSTAEARGALERRLHRRPSAA